MRNPPYAQKWEQTPKWGQEERKKTIIVNTELRYVGFYKFIWQQL
jgi:hypothetical protein